MNRERILNILQIFLDFSRIKIHSFMESKDEWLDIFDPLFVPIFLSKDVPTFLKALVVTLTVL